MSMTSLACKKKEVKFVYIKVSVCVSYHNHMELLICELPAFGTGTEHVEGTCVLFCSLANSWVCRREFLVYFRVVNYLVRCEVDWKSYLCNMERALALCSKESMT